MAISTKRRSVATILGWTAVFPAAASLAALAGTTLASRVTGASPLVSGAESRRRIGGEVAGVAAAALYAINLDVARFTFAILTDSLFTSGLLLSTYLTYRALADDRRWAWPAAAVVLITASLRPGGSFFVPIFGIFLAFALLRERGLAAKTLAATAVLTASVLLNLRPVRAVYATEDPTEWLVGGYVLIENEEYRMPMPPPTADNTGAVLRSATARIGRSRAPGSFFVGSPSNSSTHERSTRSATTC